MSVDAVGRTLVKVLRAGISPELSDVEENTLAQRIALVSPEDAANRDVWLGLFLYASIESPHLKNQPPAVDPRQTSRLRRSPLTLDLYYLLTAYGTASDTDNSGKELSAHRLLGLAMQILYDTAILHGSVLEPPLNNPELALELRVTLNPITIEDMTRIWSVFPNHNYRPSVTYLVSPAPLVSETIIDGPRVVDIRHQQGVHHQPGASS